MKTICLSVLAGAAMVLAPAAARAQMCDTLYEVISTMKLPTYGFPTVWDADYGEAGKMVQFASGIQMEEGTILAYGRKLEEKTYKPLETGIVELNRRGRALIEKFYPARESEQPVQVIRLDDKFVAVSNFRSGKGNVFRHVRLSWYDRQGGYKRDHMLSDGAYDFEAQGLAPAADGGGFVVVIHAVSRKDPSDQYGQLMRFSAQGQLIWKRAYRPGISNALYGLSVTSDHAYLATGKIIMEDGRMAGWIMKLGPDGTILWQRTYPRGKFSVLNAGAESAKTTADGGHYFLVTGSAEPGDGNPHASWVMEVDPQGEPVWQRYFRRADYTFSGRSIVSYPDGRVVVVVNATIDDNTDNNQDHIRVMTLSPRGIMINDESYLNGLEAQALHAGKSAGGEIIVTATILKEQKKDEEQFGPEKPLPEGKAPPRVPPLQEGWVMVVPGLDEYKDPCLKQPRR